MDESKKQDIIKGIENGRAYFSQKSSSGKTYIYLPIEAYKNGIVLGDITQQNKRIPFEEAMVRLFNNCTVEIEKDDAYVEVSLDEIKCRRNIHFQSRKRYIIIDGKIYDGDTICDQCEYFLKNLVNECSSSSDFRWKNKEKLVNAIDDELWEFREMKKGYLTYTNFDDEISRFDSEHVMERIEEFEDRGRFVHDKIKTEATICKECIKYKTKVCSGVSRSNIDKKRNGSCNVSKEMFSKEMEERIIKLYGSMGRALWFFSQCGQTFYYKDPNTKRESRRFICMPSSDRGDGYVNGFEMAFVNYPLGIDSNTHETFLSEKEFKEHEDISEVKTRYAKKFRDVIVAAEAYRKEKKPGDYIVTSGHTNYLAYAKIGYESYRYAGRKITVQFIIGAQTSSNTIYPVYVDDIHELLKETWNVKDLSSWY